MRAPPVLQSTGGALPFLAILSVIGGAGVGCSDSSRPSAVEQSIATSLQRVLGVEVASLSCPRPPRSGAGFACQGRLAGAGDFAVDVSTVDEAGQPVWMPRGALKFEYQIALGFAEAVRVPPSRVECPADGAIGQGFDCRVELPDGSAVAVSVAAARAGDRFEWTTRDVLMLGTIEEWIERDLGADAGPGPGPGRADCGASVQRITPGESFECAIELASGDRRTAVVSILDRDGHVQYRIRTSTE